MPISLGAGNISKIYLGSTEVTKAYLGATQVFISIEPNGLLNGLVSYYKADVSGSFPDSHGTNNGTINGATFTTSGKINGAYNFDRVNDFISLTNNSNLKPSSTTTITINIWAKNNNGYSPYGMLWNGGYQNGVASNSSGFFALTNTNIVRITGNGTNVVDASFSHNDNNWHMYTAVIKSTNSKIYIDGILRATGNVNLNSSKSNFNAELGALGTSGNFYLGGSLDEFASYNRELTQSEVTALYNSGSGLSYNLFTT